MVKTTHFVFMLVLCLGQSSTARDFADIELKMHPVAGSVYMLQGRGGNIGLSISAGGVFTVDDQFAALTNRILAKIRKLSKQPVRFLVNTHVHPGHVGGNENIGNQGALIFAHDNARKRLVNGTFDAHGPAE